MNTFDRLIKVFNVVFEDEIQKDAVTVQSDLRRDLGLNSIGMLYMAMALEEEFSIKFSNEDLMSLNTVADVVSCIEAKL